MIHFTSVDLPSPLRPTKRLSLLFDREVGILEHDVSVIVFRKLLRDHRVFTGVQGGREFQSQCGSVFLVNF